jgi:cytochrome c oxidase assembly protein subunit 15
MHAFDLLLLAFKGIAIASLPLAVVWVGRATGHPAGRLGRLAWVTAFLTFDLVVFGGFTRLTDSGLGCPDWPGCYAKANPLMAADAIHGAERAMPTGPVTMNKAWIEMIHRYLAMAIGVLIVSMLAISVLRTRRAKNTGARAPAYAGMAGALLGLVVLQGAFGAWTVTQKLQPIFVTTHLLLGLSLLAVLVWHALKLDHRSGAARAARPEDMPTLRPLAAVAFVVLAIQIALGGWVSANYAVLACTDFPTCQGVWLPAMDFANGFAPWRELGRTDDGGYLSIAALTAIHWVHRSFAAVAFVVLATLAWRLRNVPSFARVAQALAIILVLQIATGLVNVTLDWPLIAAVLHNAGAAALVVALVVINYGLSATSGTAPSATPRGVTLALPVTGLDARH